MPVRTLRIEIARPVDLSWDNAGTMLRVQRRVLPQILRAGMDARIACGVVGPKITKKVVAPKVDGQSPGAVVYQAMKAELARIQKGKWKDGARAALELPGGMLSALAQRVTQSYDKRPSFNSEQPIPIRKAETRIVLDGSAVILDLKLTSEGRTRFYARPSKGWHWDTLRRLAKGEIEHGDCKIVRDDDRGKWYALLAYDAPSEPEKTIDPAAALIVHRGVHNALTLMSTTGAVRYESGRKLLAQLQKLEARIRDAKRVSAATLGDGARGHGKGRRYQHYEALSGKRDRVVKTFCQQMAAFVVRTAREQGCNLILIENYGGQDPNEDRALRRVLVRFPLYRLKESIKNAAELVGMTVKEYGAEHISTTCPACGRQDARQHNHRTGTFHCAQCALERPADFVAALNALRRSGAVSKLWDERMAQVEKMKKELKEAV